MPLSLSLPPHFPSPLKTQIQQYKYPCKGFVHTNIDMSLPDALSRTLKSRLASGEPLYGLFMLSFSPTLAEISGYCGYDFVIVDMEHGPGGPSEALQCIRALASTHTPTILRVPDISAAWAKKALDLGPQGIMFPSVESAKSAELAVSYCRYQPRGVRGCAHSVVRASAYGFDADYLARCDEDLVIMCQAESIKGLNEVEAIAAVDGVDVVQMGPRDLGASMGYLRDPSNNKVREALLDAERRVLGARKKGGAYLAGIAGPNDPPEQLKLRGYHMVEGGVDLAMYKKAALADIKGFRNAGKETAEGSNEMTYGY